MTPILMHWSASTLALACYALAAAAHAAGLVRTLTARTRPPHLLRDAVLVQCGLLAALLALVSPLGYWSGVYLWVKAAQDLVLCFAAPGLIVAGRPWQLIRSPENDLPDKEAAWSRVGPVLAVVVFNVVWIGWHLPAAVDHVPGSAVVRLAEHACYLGAGFWFWLQIAGPRRYGRWQPPLRRLTLLTATLVAGTVLGMVLVFGASVLYPGYANPAHHVMTVLDDQQLSGAVLWMGMMPPLLIAGIWLLMVWLNDEESDISADLGRLLHRRTTGWPARPGLR